jgi:glycine hydroxymethyltransferase
MKEPEMVQIAEWIDEAIKNRSDDKALTKLHQTITTFTEAFPLPN